MNPVATGGRYDSLVNYFHSASKSGRDATLKPTVVGGSIHMDTVVDSLMERQKYIEDYAQFLPPNYCNLPFRQHPYTAIICVVEWLKTFTHRNFKFLTEKLFENGIEPKSFGSVIFLF